MRPLTLNEKKSVNVKYINCSIVLEIDKIDKKKEILKMEKLEKKCKFTPITRPDSSLILSEGTTCCVVGVYGPIEVKMQKASIDKVTVECYYRPKAGLPGVVDRFHESIIRNTCETSLVAALYPRSAVLINIQEMHDAGTLISCAINAVSLACLYSGIDMRFMFGAVTCFLIKEEFQLVPPLNEKDIKAMFVFVFNNTEGKLIASHTEGCFSTDEFRSALDLCRDESKNVFKFFKKSLLSAT